LAEVERPIVLDTDVVSLTMRGQLDVDAAGLYGRTWCVSFVTVGELVQGAAAADWGRGGGRGSPTGCGTWSSFRTTSTWPRLGA
jgi:hypothetical protein